MKKKKKKKKKKKYIVTLKGRVIKVKLECEMNNLHVLQVRTCNVEKGLFFF